MVKALGGRLYYGWIVVAVVFLALLVSAGVRAAPSVPVGVMIETPRPGCGRRRRS